MKIKFAWSISDKCLYLEFPDYFQTMFDSSYEKLGTLFLYYPILSLWREVKNIPKTQSAVSQKFFKPHQFYLHILKGNYV